MFKKKVNPFEGKGPQASPQAAFDRSTSEANLNLLHTALFGWPMDQLTPRAELKRCATLHDAAIFLIKTPRFQADNRRKLQVPVDAEDIKPDHSPSEANLNLLHTALFGWPMDWLTPRNDLMRCPTLHDAALFLVNSARFRADCLSKIQMLSELKDIKPDDSTSEANLNLLHTALFGWPMDWMTPREELMRCTSLHEAAIFLVNSPRFRADSLDKAPPWLVDKWVCTESFGLRFWVNLRDNFVSRGVLNDDWEVADVDWLCGRLSEGDGMLDVGANVGVYAMQAARKVGPTGRVYAFEPQPDVCAMLKRSVSENGYDDRMTIFHAGVGSHDHTARIWRHHHTNPGASRIVDTASAPEGTADVAIMALDNIAFDRRIKALKVDIEGFEPFMMAGAKNFFKKHRPIVLTEYFPNAIRHGTGTDPLDYIKTWIALGYRIHKFEDGVVGDELSIKEAKAIDNGLNLTNVVCLPIGE